MSTTGCYPDKAPAVNRLLDTLSNHLRREIIHYFENLTSENTATIDELVTHIDQRVPQTNPEELTVELWHNHLPTLQTREWIDMDHRSKTIRYHGHESAQPLLEDVTEVFIE